MTGYVEQRASNLWRVVVGFVVAPGLAAAAMATVTPAFAGIPDLLHRIWLTFVMYSIFGAYPTAVGLGLPIFWLLRDRIRLTLINCVIIGGVVASLPWLVLTILPSPASTMLSGGHMEIENGQKTLWWWKSSSLFIAQVGLAGMFAGIVFWLFISAGGDGRRKRRVNAHSETATD